MFTNVRWSVYIYMCNDVHKPPPASFQAYTCMISHWIKKWIYYFFSVFRGISNKKKNRKPASIFAKVLRCFFVYFSNSCSFSIKSEKSVNFTILENMDVRFASKKVIQFLKGNKEKIIANSNIFTNVLPYFKPVSVCTHGWSLSCSTVRCDTE